MFDHKKIKKHKLAWCKYCGWTHFIVRPRNVIENGIVKLTPICTNCMNNFERRTVCTICGEVAGNLMQFRTIERHRSEESEVTCNLTVGLCPKCAANWQDLEKKFNIPDNLCDTCVERFKCFTEKPTKTWQKWSSHRKRGFNNLW